MVLANVEEVTRRDNLILLTERSPVYLPDLMTTADLIVGKVGYSTVAEAYAAGTRYAMVERPDFREDPILSAFVHRHLPAIDISRAEYEDGEWIERLSELLARPRGERHEGDGALQVAREIESFLPPR